MKPICVPVVSMGTRLGFRGNLQDTRTPGAFFFMVYEFVPDQMTNCLLFVGETEEIPKMMN